MAVFTRRSAATPETKAKELDNHIIKQVKRVGLGHMGTTVSGTIHNDAGGPVGSYRGHVNGYGRLVSVETFEGQGIDHE